MNTEALLQNRPQQQRQQAHASLPAEASALLAAAQSVHGQSLGEGELDVAQRLAAVISEGTTIGVSQSEEQEDEVMCLWQWLQEWKLHG